MKEVSKITKLVGAISLALAIIPVPGCWEEDNYENHNCSIEHDSTCANGTALHEGVLVDCSKNKG